MGNNDTINPNRSAFRVNRGRLPPTNMQDALQQSFNDYLRNSTSGGGFQGILGFPDLFGAGAGMGMGAHHKKPPEPPPEEDNALHWAFPQYSQTWAFTPPVPNPYLPPPPFDPKKYGKK